MEGFLWLPTSARWPLAVRFYWNRHCSAGFEDMCVTLGKKGNYPKLATPYIMGLEWDGLYRTRGPCGILHHSLANDGAKIEMHIKKGVATAFPGREMYGGTVRPI